MRREFRQDSPTGYPYQDSYCLVLRNGEEYRLLKGESIPDDVTVVSEFVPVMKWSLPRIPNHLLTKEEMVIHLIEQASAMRGL